MDRGVWWATVHEVSKSQTWLRTHACAHTHSHWWQRMCHSQNSMCPVWSTAHISAQLVFVWWTTVWILLRPEFKEKWNTEPKFQGTMWECQMHVSTGMKREDHLGKLGNWSFQGQAWNMLIPNNTVTSKKVIFVYVDEIFLWRWGIMIEATFGFVILWHWV